MLFDGEGGGQVGSGCCEHVSDSSVTLPFNLREAKNSSGCQDGRVGCFGMICMFRRENRFGRIILTDWILVMGYSEFSFHHRTSNSE